jgi:spermidine/putrescine transport system substrate-binding protein
VLSPFRDLHPDATVRAESGTSDPDMINKLRAGEVNVWDLINVNQPWARTQLLSRGPDQAARQGAVHAVLREDAAGFASPPYPLAFADNGDLIGMPQRYGPFSFVVNTDVISREMAEDQGWKLFLDPAMKDRYGMLTYDNWNIMHMCVTGDQNPFEPMDAATGWRRSAARPRRSSAAPSC